MCGISGLINSEMSRDFNADCVAAMNAAQKYRGPNSSGIQQIDNVTLGHVRLSIIDLVGGAQPLANEDRSVWVVFNGEIYNFLDLKSELEAKGHCFSTACDTEVLVHLYEEVGDALCTFLQGMFAFAIYDCRQKKLILGRDRMGQKPLLYRHEGKRLAFSSEMAALKTLPFSLTLDDPAVQDFMVLQYIPAPKTIYKEIHKVPPASVLSFDCVSGAIQIKQYWSIETDAPYEPKCTLSFEQATRQVRELVFRAVKKRLMADVPLGAFLSGGLDSSVICGVASQLTTQPVSVFTIGFHDNRYDEREYARFALRAIEYATGKFFQVNEQVVEPCSFDLLRKLLRHYGEPFADASMLPTALLCKFAAEHVVVALSVYGADEVFGGYERYLALHYTRKFPQMLRPFFLGAATLLPSGEVRSRIGRFRRLLVAAGLPEDRSYASLMNHFPGTFAKNLAGERLWNAAENEMDFLCHYFNTVKADNPVEKAMGCDLQTYLPGDILAKVDIASMCSSLEVRSPFLDHELISFVASLPVCFKQCGRSRKHILQAAFSDMLPKAVRCRAKRGFGVPVSNWLRTVWYEDLCGYLLNGKAVQGGFLQNEALERVIKHHHRGQQDYGDLLWSCLILELFLHDET